MKLETLIENRTRTLSALELLRAVYMCDCGPHSGDSTCEGRFFEEAITATRVAFRAAADMVRDEKKKGGA